MSYLLQLFALSCRDAVAYRQPVIRKTVGYGWLLVGEREGGGLGWELVARGVCFHKAFINVNLLPWKAKWIWCFSISLYRRHHRALLLESAFCRTTDQQVLSDCLEVAEKYRIDQWSICLSTLEYVLTDPEYVVLLFLL